MSVRRTRDDAHPYRTYTPVPLYSSYGTRYPSADEVRGCIDHRLRDVRMLAQHHYEQWGERAEVVNASGKVLFVAGPRHDYDEMFLRKVQAEERDGQ